MRTTRANREQHPRDTTADAVAAQDAVMRALPASRRMQMALEMSDELADIAKSGGRSRAYASRRA